LFQNTAHEARRLLLLLHLWTGLPREMKLYSNIMLDYAAEKFPTTFT
jgi:hypothetical protein